MRISDWSSDVCSSDLTLEIAVAHGEVGGASVVLTATVTVAAAPRFAVTLKQVLMDLDTARPVAWPPEWRARLALPSTPSSNRPAGHAPAAMPTASPRRAVSSLPAASLDGARPRSEEHTYELQSLMRISYAVFCLKKKKQKRS